MDSHRQYRSLCTLYLCDFLSSRTIHAAKTRHERLFSGSSFSSISGRSFLSPHYPAIAIASHARRRNDSISHHISYTLYARDENRMGKEKYVYSPRRMFDTPLDLWWRSLCSRSRASSNHSQLYTCLYYDPSYPSLCSSLISYRFF